MQSFSAASIIQRPSAKRVSPTQKFLSFGTTQVDKNKKLSLNPPPSTRLQNFPSDDAFKTTLKANSQASQKFLGHGAMQLPLNELSFGEPSCSVITKKTSLGNPTTRPEQLTIFYAGSVNVYDDVLPDKVQAILLIASKVSTTAVKAVNLSSGASLLPPFKGLVSNGQNLTQTLDNTNHVPYSCSGHSKTLPRDANSTKVMISPSHNEPSKIINSSMRIDNSAIYVPRARNATLVRFLEKRKERMSTKTSFPSEKNSSKNSVSLADVASSSKCSSTDISISSNQGGSWHEGHQIKSCNDNNDPPSTK